MQCMLFMFFTCKTFQYHTQPINTCGWYLRSDLSRGIPYFYFKNSWVPSLRFTRHLPGPYQPKGKTIKNHSEPIDSMHEPDHSTHLLLRLVYQGLAFCVRYLRLRYLCSSNCGAVCDLQFHTIFFNRFYIDLLLNLQLQFVGH